MILMAARASRTENQDAIDTAIVGMLADPMEVSYCFFIIIVTRLCRPLHCFPCLGNIDLLSSMVC